jgi:Outer membrane protein beta-barrel domain
MILFFLLIGLGMFPRVLWAEDTSSGSGKPTKTLEDDDFYNTPFTEYGEFNESKVEDEDTKFFQYGRFFGVSLGAGFEFVDGNRGALWQGGFPVVDFKVHYWFDFNLALDLGFFTAQHFFDTTIQNIGHVDVNIFHVGIDVKYYFDTQNLSAPISFANPYLLIGAGDFSKTLNYTTQNVQDKDDSLGVSFGAGLEFAISPRKTYLEIEGKMHLVTFKDTYSTQFSSLGLNDLTGRFYTISANILFTW